MYRILTAFLFLLPFFAKGQTHTSVDQGATLYKFKNGLKVDSALFLPRKDTATADLTMRAPGMLVYRPQDSLLYYRKGDAMTPVSTGGGDLSNYYTKSQSDTRFVHYTDTSLMLAPYLRKSDTTSMLLPYLRKIDTTGMLNNYYTKPESDNRFVRKDTAFSLSAWVPSYVGYHAAEGSVFPLNGDTLINIFRLDTAQQHAGGKGQIVKRYSYNNGKTWTPLTIVYDGPDDDRNVVAGKLDNNRIIVLFRRYTGGGTDTDVGRIYSDDKGTTWSSYAALPAFLTTVALSFGTIIKGGDLAWHVILHKPGQCVMYKSIDNGVNWTVQNNIFTTPATAGETSVAYVGNNRMIALTRDDAAVDSTYIQFTSINNGDTWARAGRVNMNQNNLLNNRTAPFIMWDSARSIVIATSYYRNQLSNSPYSPREDSVFFYINNPNDVLNNNTNWALKFRIPRPQPSQISTYGYPNLCKLTNGNYFGVYSENGTIGTGDIFGGEERTYLTQFNINYGDKDSTIYEGLNNQYNSLTGGIDHFSLLQKPPDSVYSIPSPASLWVGVFKGQTKSPLSVKNTTNGSLFDVSTTGNIIASGSYTSLGTAPSFILSETDASNGYQVLVNSNQLFFNRLSDGALMFSNRLSDGFMAFNGTVQTNTGQFISRGTSPRYRFVNTGLTNFDWQFNTEIGDMQVQLMNSDSSGVVNRAVFKANGQWVIPITPPAGSIATDSINGRKADGTIVYFNPLTTLAVLTPAATQTGIVNITGLRVGGTNSQFRAGELNATTTYIQGTDPAGSASRDIAFLRGGSEIMRITSIGLGIGVTPTSKLHVTGSEAHTVTAISSNTTLGEHNIVEITTGSITITLPTASTVSGRVYEIRNRTASTCTITSVDVDGTGTTLFPANTYWKIYSNGSAWRLLSRSN